MLQHSALAGWGEEIMAIEPSALRGFGPRKRSRRGEKSKAEVSGMAVEWEDGAARMGGVALIQIEGPLSRCAGWWSMGYDEILEAHDEAFRSDARAVLQVVHSPGGYLSGLDETAAEIETMARRAGKPLHSLAADMSYSAAERLAFCASKRWVTRAGGAGSIGVIVTRPDFTEANKLAGLRFEQIASGEFKTDGDPDVALTKGEIERIRERVMFHAGLFFDAGARATGLSVDQIRGQQAALFLGENAVNARLADGVRTLAQCVTALEAETQIQGRAMVAVPNGPRGQHSAKGYSMEIGTLVTLLGLTAGATDQDISGRAQALVTADSKLRELTGKASPEAALAVIDGWREGAAQLTSALAELAKVREREEKAAYSALIVAGEEKAQITPGNRAKVLEKFPTAATLGAFLEVAPAALPGRAGAGETAAIKSTEGVAVGTGGNTGEPAALTYKGKTYAACSFSERAAWLNDKEHGAQGRAAKAEYDRSKGG